MNWTDRDMKALQIAEDRFDKTPPGERMSFDRYLEDAYDVLYQEENPDDGYRYFGGPND